MQIVGTICFFILRSNIYIRLPSSLPSFLSFLRELASSESVFNSYLMFSFNAANIFTLLNCISV